MGFFKEEAKRISNWSLEIVPQLVGQKFSLEELKDNIPNWEDWEYNMEDEEVSAVGSFGLDADTYDKILYIKVRPIDNEHFIVIDATIEENINN